jgi:hypothetical protein
VTDDNTTTEPTDQTADESTDEGQEPADETTDQGPDDEQAAGDEPTEDQETGEDEGTTLSPDDAVKAVSKLRKENASWRTKFRDLEAKMADAVTPEKIEELRNELAANSRALLVENVALKYDLPAELAERLTGDSREDLEADAKKLVKFVTAKGATSADDLSGGLDPSSDDGEFDAQEYARNMRRRKNNF